MEFNDIQVLKCSNLLMNRWCPESHPVSCFYFPLCTVHCALHTVHTVHTTLYCTHCTLYTAPCTHCTLHRILQSTHCSLHTVHPCLNSAVISERPPSLPPHPLFPWKTSDFPPCRLHQWHDPLNLFLIFALSSDLCVVPAAHPTASIRSLGRQDD